jgi:hypothetical protein
MPIFLPRITIVLTAMAMLIFAQVGSVQPTKKPEEGKKAPTHAELIAQAVDEIVKMQEEDGQWAYEGVYRVAGKIPVGYRVGGTATVANALLIAVPEHPKAKAAVLKGLAFVMKDLNDPLMAPSTKDGYDVRVWGHACALEFLCNLRAAKLAGKDAKEVDSWIAKLAETLVTEEITGGGWNYASRRQHASFVTAPVTQALLLARAQGEKIPDAVFERARKVLEASRAESGGFIYSGAAPAKEPKTLLPGAVARNAVCETTLTLLGGSSPEAIQASINACHQYWHARGSLHDCPLLLLLRPPLCGPGYRDASRSEEAERARQARRGHFENA